MIQGTFASGDWVFGKLSTDTDKLCCSGAITLLNVGDAHMLLTFSTPSAGVPATDDAVVDADEGGPCISDPAVAAMDAVLALFSASLSRLSRLLWLLLLLLLAVTSPMKPVYVVVEFWCWRV